MKKKITLTAFVILTLSQMNAQTFVSTSPSKKNAILEEFTGIYCTYCPDGHKRANDLSAAYPDRFYQINIHQGGLAVPSGNDVDLRTPFGDALASQAGVSGYPCGSVNRRLFPSETAISVSRTMWANYVPVVLNESSYVNVAAKSSIDFATRTLTVDVEVYYTADAFVSKNNINVALVQNHILGHQTGMLSNPEQIYKDSIYIHQHALRHLLTGQWGDDTTVTATAANSFFSARYSYVIPENLNNVPYVLDNLEVIVFIAEGDKNIVTATKSEMIYLNTDPVLGDITEIETNSCDAAFALDLKNYWHNKDITSLDFEYEVYGEIFKYHWQNGTIAANTVDTVVLPPVDLRVGDPAIINVTITAINGDTSFDITKSYPLEKMKYEVDAGATLKLVTDRYGNQITWRVFDGMEKAVDSGGPYGKLSYNGTATRIIALPLSTAGCYAVKIYDSAGDGINHGTGAGYIDILSADGDIIVHNDGRFKHETGFYLLYKGEVGIENISMSPEFRINSNPVKNVLQIEGLQDYQTAVILNINGQSVNFVRNGKNLDVSHLKSGQYFLQIKTGNKTEVLKFIKM